ncbi:Mitogen-activated protein kinase kinase kinase YODA [Spatholobus suberectus]|nr:Mitogen-activated protein kinase kinase kinase YODA [Spatholobus suberectus]
MLSLETARHESNAPPVNVHPLPLPLRDTLPSPPTANPFSPVVAKSELLPMKSQWQKGKLIGRGMFGSVYVATNRDIKGANLLVDSASGVKLADFGMAKHMSSKSPSL